MALPEPISALPAATAGAATDEFAINQGGTTKRITPAVVETATGVDPNGVVTATGPAFCGSPAGGLWFKPASSGTGNTGWIQLISE